MNSNKTAYALAAALALNAVLAFTGRVSAQTANPGPTSPTLIGRYQAAAYADGGYKGYIVIDTTTGQLQTQRFTMLHNSF